MSEGPEQVSGHKDTPAMTIRWVIVGRQASNQLESLVHDELLKAFPRAVPVVFEYPDRAKPS